MPRTLARIKFKIPKPRAPVDLTALPLYDEAAALRTIRDHVVQQSRPRPLRVATVVSPSWKTIPGKSRKIPYKPHTLRDVIDPEGKAAHGEIIYIFRNTRTNQVIYSLAGLLDDHHREQLPFIGKHSKPPVLRPDEWVPHCVVTFPSASQGAHAFRKLREFRKLHELSWNKTNPEWGLLEKKELINKIMDQRANTSADLAQVLSDQKAQGKWMQETYDEQERQSVRYMDRKWPEVDALANAAEAKARNGDNIKWIEHQIHQLTFQLSMSHNQDEANQKRLKTARLSHQRRLRKLTWALRKAQLFGKVQADLEKQAAPANMPGAEERLSYLKDKLASAEVIENKQVAEYRQEIKKLEDAFEAKKKADTRDHYAARSILPQTLRAKLPKPFTLDGVELKWADLQDAEYARGKWPESIAHDILGLKESFTDVMYMRAEEYNQHIEAEIRKIFKNTVTDRLEAERMSLLPPEPVEEPTKGVWDYLPKWNQGKRAEA